MSTLPRSPVDRLYDAVRCHEAKLREQGTPSDGARTGAFCVQEVMELDGGILLVRSESDEHVIFFDREHYQLREDSPTRDSLGDGDVGMLCDVTARSFPAIAETARSLLRRKDGRPIMVFEEEDGGRFRAMPLYYTPLPDYPDTITERRDALLRAEWFQGRITPFTAGLVGPLCWATRTPVRLTGLRDCHYRLVVPSSVRVSGDAWLVFVDLQPIANWAHSCLYVIVAEDGVMIVPHRYPPSNELFRELERVEGLERALTVPQPPRT